MGLKLKNDPRKKFSYMKTKGPGTYDEGLHHMTKNGKYFVSKFKSTKGYSIPRPSTCNNLLNKSKTTFFKVIFCVGRSKHPGPARYKYEMYLSFNKTGKNFTSKFRTSKSRFFPH